MVQWDSGTRANYRVGDTDSYDLRLFDNAATGIRHLNVICDTCRENGILGLRWKCLTCENYDLCSNCYMNGKHNISHPFKRIDTPKASGVELCKRMGLSQTEARGIFVGAKVTRGPDWMWDNQDGGNGGVGIVISIGGLNDTSGRCIANVRWNKTQETNIYRFGHRGKMDIKYLEAMSGGYYYPDHMPVIGKTLDEEDDPLNIKIGDKVKIEVEEVILKQIQTGHGGWNPEMSKYIGKIGIVCGITPQADIKVQFGGCSNTWTFNSAALTKEAAESITAGTTVLILDEKTLVKQLQKGHGEWVSDMSSCLGKTGRVLRIDSEGDLRVKVDGHTWTINPLCVSLIPNATWEPVTDEEVDDELDSLSELFLGLLDLLEPDGSFSLVAEAREGDVDAVRKLLKKYPDKVNDKNSEKTALQVAAYQGHTEIVKLLLEANADMELGDKDGDTALHYAAYGNEPEITELLLTKEANINAVNKKGLTALHVAVGKESVSCVKVLIKYNCNVNMQDSIMDTALHDAIGSGNLEIVDLLLGIQNIDLSLCNKRGFNALHHAALKGHNYIVQRLLAKTMHLVNTKKEDGYTALHLAALNDHRTVAETLLLKGNCEVNPKNKIGQTPLFLASLEANCSLVELIVNQGADVNAKDDDGDTALHAALFKTSKQEGSMKRTDAKAPQIQEIFTNLRKLKLDQVYLAIACFLCQNGADLNLKNQKGKAPIDLITDSAVKDVLAHYASVKSNYARHSTNPATCSICDEEPAVMFEPCGHMVSCETCSMRMKKCMYCRTAIVRKSSIVTVPKNQHQLQKLAIDTSEDLIAETTSQNAKAVNKVSNHQSCKISKSPTENIGMPSLVTNKNESGPSNERCLTNIDLSNRQVSQRIKVTIIGKKIGMHWKALGRLLDLPEYVIERTDMEERRVQDKAEAVITHWQNAKGKGATLDILIKNLQSLDCNHLVEEILNMMKDFPGDHLRHTRLYVAEFFPGVTKTVARDSGSSHDLTLEPAQSLEFQQYARIIQLLSTTPSNKEIQLKHAWNPDDRSQNIFIKGFDRLTFSRKSVVESTDCIRGRIGYTQGLHMWEIQWDTTERGMHAVVGVATSTAPLHCVGYKPLVGCNAESWGWEITRHKLCHDLENKPEVSYPKLIGVNEKFTVPDSFLVALDMDEGTLSFIVDERYLGIAFSHLKGKKLYPIVSTVSEKCEITMKYIGKLD